MRNVSKNKWFLTCFRPVVDIDDMLEPRAVVDHSANRRFTCIPVADKHDTKDSVTKTTFSEQEFAQNWVVVPHPQKRKFSKCCYYSCWGKFWQTFKLRYLGDDLVLIIGIEEKKAKDMIEKGEDSFLSLFHSIRRWNTKIATSSRLLWGKVFQLPN
ncbi:hypothetical protein JHK84_034775 [Glycine max]|nr:hypothetical protein JHK85_035151 [Glycine max]KAG5141007.1 hypothetical protein JHK84_034775 [Glycine max]